MKHAELIQAAKDLVKEANDPGECIDYARAVARILRKLGSIANGSPKLQDALFSAAAEVRYPRH